MENNKSEKKNSSLPLIYVLGMPILFIVGNFMANLHVTLVNSTLYFCALIYPLTYLISGLIIKRTNYKDSIRLMAVSLASAALAFIVQWALLDTVDGFVMIYAFLSFLLGQLIFIYFYDFLRNIKKDTYIPVFLLLVVIEVMDAAFFGILIEGQYFSLTTLVRVIYAVVLPVALARKTTKTAEEKK